ncbi:UTRA domain-containing protein [Halomonas sp. MCCC 1A11036]|uniref:UTRA domain-containing protein n=1 Tax=Billgrantia zhangzhouensis TaxID=2733481 RepID=A0ABS9AGL4_9GAMM|nr:UTRA domain-containing protein [Halomonas zhangzhouensis]MCE8020898.1 UTRA domain-containing protein [Halomonas zhangzhouensis]
MSDAYYLRLTDHLRELLSGPEAFEEGRLPAERTLAERFRTTRVTLRQALAQLEGEGLIHRSNRRGWFVSPARLDYDPTRDAGFNDYVRAQGRRPRTEVLHTDTRPHRPAAEALGLPVDCSFHHIRRRRFVDDRAVLAESLWVVPARAPDLLQGDFAANSLWGELRSRWGLTLAHRSLRLYSEALAEREAAELGVAPGTAGLSVRRAIFDAQRRPVEYDEEHWLHDALCITVELENKA